MRTGNLYIRLAYSCVHRSEVHNTTYELGYCRNSAGYQNGHELVVKTPVRPTLFDVRRTLRNQVDPFPPRYRKNLFATTLML
jgi:hypothetical protein